MTSEEGNSCASTAGGQEQSLIGGKQVAHMYGMFRMHKFKGKQKPDGFECSGWFWAVLKGIYFIRHANFEDKSSADNRENELDEELGTSKETTTFSEFLKTFLIHYEIFELYNKHQTILFLSSFLF